MTDPSYLGNARRGFTGRIVAVTSEPHHAGPHGPELENRLVEMGFIEGAHVEILHEGAFGKDPIAVRVDNATVAIRRREAMCIQVTSMQVMPIEAVSV